MRILPAALVLSAAVHGAAIAWVRTREDIQPQAPHTRPPPIQIITIDGPGSIEAPPVAVVLLDDRPTAGVASAGSGIATTRGSATRGSARISNGHTGVTGAPHGTDAPTHSAVMDMRKPEVTQGISDDFVASFLAHSKPLAPKAIEGERIQDEIAYDEQHLHDPRWIANATPDEVGLARESLEMHRAQSAARELTPDGTGTKADHMTFVAHVDGDGTTHLEDKANVQRHGLGVTFDVTDALMRHFGDDPYASNKRKFLDQTREERYQIGTEYKHQQLAHSTHLMQSNIDRLWATQPTLDARKRGLFELWDECAETGTDDVTASGRAARDLVVGAIRSRLTGADAYTASELGMFNAHRTSKATFAPYDD